VQLAAQLASQLAGGSLHPSISHCCGPICIQTCEKLKSDSEGNVTAKKINKIEIVVSGVASLGCNSGKKGMITRDKSPPLSNSPNHTILHLNLLT